VTPEQIYAWFVKVERHLSEKNLSHILLDPDRVFNGDETLVLLDPETREVLALKGSKDVYQIEQAAAKQNITTMFTFTASGRVLPPMLVYPYKRVPADVCESVPREWGIGKSERGWMTSKLFISYIENIVVPFLEEKKTPLPVIYFVDGHGSHLTYEVSRCCEENQIILICLYPNSTHIMQPADVAAFKPLKSVWSRLVEEWKEEHLGCLLSTRDVAPILKEAVKIYEDTSIVKNGFRACGLYPFDKNAIRYEKCLNTTKKVIHGIPLSTPMSTSISTITPIVLPSVTPSTTIDLFSTETQKLLQTPAQTTILRPSSTITSTYMQDFSSSIVLDSEIIQKARLAKIIGHQKIEQYKKMDFIPENEEQTVLYNIVQECFIESSRNTNSNELSSEDIALSIDPGFSYSCVDEMDINDNDGYTLAAISNTTETNHEDEANEQVPDDIILLNFSSEEILHPEYQMVNII
jgi:hypothetical protein